MYVSPRGKTPTSVQSHGFNSSKGFLSSRGFKNRNVKLAPPSKEELIMGMQSAGLLKMNQRILGGKAVVSPSISKF